MIDILTKDANALHSDNLLNLEKTFETIKHKYE